MKITVGDQEFILNDAQIKAFEYVAISIFEWVKNAVENRARQAIDEIVTEHSDKQPQKISIAEKEQIVRDADIKSAQERQSDLEAMEVPE